MLEVRILEVSPEIINKVYKEKVFELDIHGPRNSYVLLRNECDLKNTAIVQHLGKGIWCKIRNSNELTVAGLKGRDSKQCVLINSLLDDNILVNVVIGQAGTGKTTLALGYALDQWFQEQKRIVLCKPTVMVGEGRAFGPVPGDVEEKYAPYLASYEIAIKRLLGPHGRSQLESMKRKKDIEYVPIELVRGSEFENCTFLLDEAQNMSWHELKTVISRMGKGTKIIIMGDLRQIDLDCRPEDTGLHKLINSAPFMGSPVSSQIQLTAQYRSPITKLIADVDEWLAKPPSKGSFILEE